MDSMTSRQFRARLKAAAISQRKFAQFFGWDVVTVNRWANGRADVPQHAARIIEILAAHPELVAEYAMRGRHATALHK